MRREDRASVRQLFAFRCGYCGVTETDVGAELTVDHFQPLSRGGTDDLDNLVYACHPCNEFKSDFWDPETECRILHPQIDAFAQHVSESADGRLTGLTPTGAFHIERLRLNRPHLVRHRQETRLRDQELARMEELLRRLAMLEVRVDTLTSELQRLEEQGLQEP